MAHFVDRGYNDKVPLYIAAGKGYTSAVQLLIDHGANINIQDHQNLTPLHNASFRSSKIVKMLLDNRAHVNAKDRYDQTPLHWSTEKGHDEIVRILLDYGANPNEKITMARHHYILRLAKDLFP